jgi:hypothetical protein
VGARGVGLGLADEGHEGVVDQDVDVGRGPADGRFVEAQEAWPADWAGAARERGACPEAQVVQESRAEQLGRQVEAGVALAYDQHVVGRLQRRLARRIADQIDVACQAPVVEAGGLAAPEHRTIAHLDLLGRAGQPGGRRPAVNRLRTSAQAVRIAGPENSIDIDPTVRPSSGISPVAAGTTRSLANGTSSSSAAICAKAVAIPWPYSMRPKATRTRPSGSKLTQRSRRGFAASIPGIMPAAPSRSRRAASATGFEHPIVDAAAAEVPGEGGRDLLAAGVGIAVEQALAPTRMPERQ